MCLELYYEYYQTNKIRPENSVAERTKEMIAYYVGDLMEKLSLAGVVVEQKVHVVFEKEDECYIKHSLTNHPTERINHENQRSKNTDLLC